MTVFEALNALPVAVVWAAVFVLGLMVGSFLNVVILRLPPRLMQDWRVQCQELLELKLDPDTAPEPPPGLVKPRSRCPQCGSGIAWYDNIPVLSWLILRARCRQCQARIGLRYPLVELATGLLSLWVIVHFGPGPEGLSALVLVWALIAATGIDFDHQLLPDQITLPLLWLGLLINLNWQLFASLEDAVIGAVAGYLLLWSVFHLFRLATGKEGMGYGDFKLLGALGAWMGWQLLPVIILLASLVGAIVGILMMIIARRGKDIPIAFGPYLAAAGFIALLYGDGLVAFWLYP
ncbi:MAG: A24 family peptidase [Wenzhouxiangella sp.]|nr:A24 family peptidase [Wenzhouxiangella sp.]